MDEPEPSPRTVNAHILKCVACKNVLQKPIQMSECLHIICMSCVDGLKAGREKNVVCPQCEVENINPKVLHRISGLNLKSPDNEEKMCGECKQNAAQWSCFNCAVYLCSACRAHHSPKHTVYLLFHQPCLLRPSFSTGSRDQTDSPSPIICPLCMPEERCPHRDLIRDLNSPTQEGVTKCGVPNHQGSCGEQDTLRFFCVNEDEREHWRPMCGECSLKGEHKECPSLNPGSVAGHIGSTIKETEERMRMLLYRLQQDLRDRQRVEMHLRDHVRDVEREITERKERILYHLTQALDKTVKEGKKKGDDILNRYEGEMQRLSVLITFVKRLESAFRGLEVGNPDENLAQYINAFEFHKRTAGVMDELETFCLENGVYDDKRFEEMRLVLPSVPDESSVLPLLSEVCSESRHPRLNFEMVVDVQFAMDSFVVINDNECMYTEKRVSETYGSMTKLNRNGVFQRIDIPRGRYHVARMKSGEIVASREYSEGRGNSFDVVYCKSIESDKAKFVTVYKPEFELGGIAVTSDNSILVCANLEGNKKVMSEKEARSYLMVISLQGKVLRSSSSLRSPRHVAVSKTGEIAVSDPDDFCVVIMDADLNEVDRVKYLLPTSLEHCTSLTTADTRFKFRPEGLCYDRCGRIIVADPNNNSVVRLFRNAQGMFAMEPLLVHRQDLHDFVAPYLVAISEDGKLWVVCKRKLFVFDYLAF